MKLWGKAFAWILVLLAVGYIIYTFGEVFK